MPFPPRPFRFPEQLYTTCGWARCAGEGAGPVRSGACRLLALPPGSRNASCRAREHGCQGESGPRGPCAGGRYQTEPWAERPLRDPPSRGQALFSGEVEGGLAFLFRPRDSRPAPPGRALSSSFRVARRPPDMVSIRPSGFGRRLSLSEPRRIRPHRLARPRTPAFHGGNGGSNPPGDAKHEARAGAPRPARAFLRPGPIAGTRGLHSLSKTSRSSAAISNARTRRSSMAQGPYSQWERPILVYWNTASPVAASSKR